MSTTLKEYYSSLLEYTILKKFKGVDIPNEIKKILKQKSRICFEDFTKSDYDITPLFTLQAMVKEANIEPNYLNWKGSLVEKDPKKSLINFLSTQPKDVINLLFSDYFYLPCNYASKEYKILVDTILSLPKENFKLEKIITVLSRKNFDEHSINEFSSYVNKLNNFYKEYTKKNLEIKDLESAKKNQNKLIYLALIKQIINSKSFEHVSHEFKTKLIENNNFRRDGIEMLSKLCGTPSLIKVLYFNILKSLGINSSPSNNCKNDIKDLILDKVEYYNFCKENLNIMKTISYIYINEKDKEVILIPKSLYINEKNYFNYYELFCKLFENRNSSEFEEIVFELTDTTSIFSLSNMDQEDVDDIIEQLPNLQCLEDYLAIYINKFSKEKDIKKQELQIKKPLTLMQIISIFKLFSKIISTEGIESIFNINTVRNSMIELTTVFEQKKLEEDAALLLLTILQQNRQNIIKTFNKFSEPSKYVNTVLPEKLETMSFDKINYFNGSGINNPINDVLENFISDTLVGINDFDNILPFDEYKYNIIGHSNDLIDLFDIGFEPTFGGLIVNNSLPTNEQELINLFVNIYNDVAVAAIPNQNPRTEFNSSDITKLNNTQKRLVCCCNRIINQAKVFYRRLKNIYAATGSNISNFQGTRNNNRMLMVSLIDSKLRLAINVNMMYICSFLLNKIPFPITPQIINALTTTLSNQRIELMTKYLGILNTELRKIDNSV